MQEDENWALQLQQVLKTALESACGSDWGYHITNNWGLESDIVEAFDAMPIATLELQERSVTPHGLVIYATVGQGLTSLSEVTQAIFDLLSTVREELFLLLPLHDSETLKYWFVIGSASHGHIGEIIIRRESMPHIDLTISDSVGEGSRE
ncbi:MAG TPA: hypothetical protein VK140_07410 [Ktedonobacteraceae bacterium]|nr:hypothetical protein [Ktedonobacteraceae bacterium]